MLVLPLVDHAGGEGGVDRSGRNAFEHAEATGEQEDLGATTHRVAQQGTVGAVHRPRALKSEWVRHTGRR